MVIAMGHFGVILFESDLTLEKTLRATGEIFDVLTNIAHSERSLFLQDTNDCTFEIWTESLGGQELWRRNLRKTQRLTSNVQHTPLGELTMIIDIRECNNLTIKSQAHIWNGVSESHIFDGKILLSDATSFQVCDITDPVLKLLLDDEASRRETFDVRLIDLHASQFPATLTLLRIDDSLGMVGSKARRWIVSKPYCGISSSYCARPVVHEP